MDQEQAGVVDRDQNLVIEKLVLEVEPVQQFSQGTLFADVF